MGILRIGLALLLCTAAAAVAQDTRFAYVGVLQDGADPAPTGSYDLRVRLYDGADGAAVQLGADALREAVAVDGGVFTLELDFGDAVLAPEAWLELAVRPAGSGSYEVLAPRQRLHAVPTALYAESTDWSGVANPPPGFADGVDDDTLAALGCGEGQVPVHAPVGWSCGTPPTGEPGLGVLGGAGTPPPALGRDGEFYIDTAVHAIYGPKVAGDWGAPTSLVGPPGPAIDDTPLPPLGTVEFQHTGQVMDLHGFTVSMERLVEISGGGVSQLGQPRLGRMELVLGPADHGLALLSAAVGNERGRVRIRLAPGGRLLLEANGVLLTSLLLQASGVGDGNTRAVAQLDPEHWDLSWNQHSFSWTFRDEFGNAFGDGPDPDCNDLFSRFGHPLPGDVAGIPLLSAPAAIDLSREVGPTGSVTAARLAPLALAFALEPHGDATEARPTCAARLLVHDEPDALATSIEMFSEDRPALTWRASWREALARSMAIIGERGEVRIELSLLATEEVCHILPGGQQACFDPTPGTVTSARAD